MLHVEWNLRHLWATAKRHAAKLFVAANKNDKIAREPIKSIQRTHARAGKKGGRERTATHTAAHTLEPPPPVSCNNSSICSRRQRQAMLATKNHSRQLQRGCYVPRTHTLTHTPALCQQLVCVAAVSAKGSTNAFKMAFGLAYLT